MKTLRIRPPLLVLVNLAVLLGVAPVYPFLELPAQLGYPLAALAGYLGERRGRQLLGDRAATLLGIGLFIFYALQLSRTHFVAPVVNLLVLLLAIRLVSDKSPRHLLQLFMLALFTLAASSLLSLSITFFVCLVPQVLLITMGLVLLTFQQQAPQLQLNRQGWRLLLGTALLLPAGSLLLMLFFYAILPRTEYPLWGFLNPPTHAQAGFSDEVRPGSFSALAQVNSIAFRVEMEERPPEQLYWRTIVLNHTDGVGWTRMPGMPVDRAPRGPGLEQRIFLEPKTDAYLPQLDAPQQLTGSRTHAAGDLVQTTERRPQRRIHYRAISRPDGRSRMVNPALAKTYLQRPEKIDPRLLDLAQHLRKGDSRAGRIALLEDFFRRQQLRYSARNLPQTTAPVATFLFETKRGYCEYFASSFALLLRLADVPARLVGGFLGGSYNAFGGYYLVGEETAHVWVEALLEDGRWRRIDPSRLAVNAASELLARREPRLSLWTTLTDSLNHTWNQAVITYDFQRQVELLRAASQQIHQPNWHPGTGVWSVTGILLAVGLGWRFRGRRKSGAERHLEKIIRAAEQRYGPQDLGNSGLFEWAERLRDPGLMQITRNYARLVYGREKGVRSDWKLLHAQLKRWQRDQEEEG